MNQRNIQAKEGHFDGSIIDGVCGNMLWVGRGRQPCGTNLKTAVRYPYPPISTWLIDRITVNPKVAETINAAAAVTSSQLVTITIHL